MSGLRVLSDTGSMRVTVEHGQWDSGVDEDIVADLAEEIRFHSLDEQTAGHRSSWSGFEDALKETRHGGRRSHPTISFPRPMSPGRLHVMGDVTRRHRSSSGGRRFSASALKERSISDGYVGHGQGQVNATRLIRLSRDATQPNSGSMSDLRGEGHEDDDEETDVLPALSAVPVNRPRSFTCPDIKVMQRKTKVKLMHRPPTPTPGDDHAAAGLASHLESSCALSNSGEIFVHDEEDELPVISET